MERLDGGVAVVVGAGPRTGNLQVEALPKQAEVASEKERVEQKPRASEEIVIEEISIDGMCGVY